MPILLRLGWPAALLVVAVGCWSGGEPEPPLVPAWSPTSHPERVELFEASEGVDIAVQFIGVGTLYRSFFLDPAQLQPLASALGACVKGRATLALSYDEPTRVGHVALVLPASHLTCRAAPAGEGIDITPMVPVLQALAAYRNGLGATKDMRLYSFRTALHVEDGFGAVTLWLEGQDPIDGTAVGRCLGLDGFERCVADAAPDGLVTLDVVDGRRRRRMRDLIGPL